MAVTSMKQLLEAGVHFGHQTKRWNPKMAKYIYAARNDIHIIDLQISVEKVEEAYLTYREDEWVKRLKKRFKVEINQEVLKTVNVN